MAEAKAIAQATPQITRNDFGFSTPSNPAEPEASVFIVEES